MTPSPMHRPALAKLTPERVREMRRRHQQGEGCTTLARRFNVRKQTAWSAINGFTWKWVTPQ